jgi:uncharacterized protein YggT (Ycf19 family)
MAAQQKPSDTTLVVIKASRVLTYLVYAYAVVATVFLTLGFFLLLFSANPSTPFVEFVSKVASNFLEPFRGIFPLHKISETGYFSGSMLFAIIMYVIAAMVLHALITYITEKIVKHENDLADLAAGK